jgi:polygalacturonase
VGTETHADIADVQFIDCIAEDSNRGLGIFSRDSGIIERIRFERMEVDCHETPIGFWGSGEALTLTALDRRRERPAGGIRDVLIDGLSGRAEGAVLLYAERSGMISGAVLRNISLDQRPGTLGTSAMMDLRPTAADLKVPEGAEGRANSWVRLGDGTIAGLIPYAGGLPGLYSHAVDSLVLESVVIRRPDPLPTSWNEEVVVQR